MLRSERYGDMYAFGGSRMAKRRVGKPGRNRIRGSRVYGGCIQAIIAINRVIFGSPLISDVGAS
jgi:hypothetical protein